MKALYWITVLGKLGNALTIISIISIVICGTICLVSVMMKYVEGEECATPVIRKSFWGLMISLFILIGSLFIPTTKEMYIIYGVGGTIDYVRDSDEAKKLPENVFKACNKYFESIDKEDKDTTKE